MAHKYEGEECPKCYGKVKWSSWSGHTCDNDHCFSEEEMEEAVARRFRIKYSFLNKVPLEPNFSPKYDIKDLPKNFTPTYLSYSGEPVVRDQYGNLYTRFSKKPVQKNYY